MGDLSVYSIEVHKNDCRIYGAPVRAYWHGAETGMIEGMDTVLKNAAGLDHEAAFAYITEYCNRVQEQAFLDAGRILNDVRWYRSANSNTLKNGRNPETHEIIDALKPVDPLKLDLDNSAYRFTADLQAAADKKGS